MSYSHGDFKPVAVRGGEIPKLIGGKGQLRISKEDRARMTDRLKTLTKRNQGCEFEALILEINAFLRGWLSYYGLASAKV